VTAISNKRYLILAAMILAGAVIAAASYSYRSVQPGRLALRFHPFVGDEALVLDQVRYANPGGEGLFKVRDFQFFISNIRLVSDSAEFVERESYHLARFDSDDGTYVIVIENIPRGDYRRIEFGIGVDPATNGTLTSVGELDPNGRMAWSWEIGYKFVLLEGGLVVDDIQYPLVYHVGFDENYRLVSLELGEPLFDRPEAVVDFRTDLLQMFSGAETVDMAVISTVKFDRTDAKLLADNYSRMVSICSSDCGR
jgi:hypothetical protein